MMKKLLSLIVSVALPFFFAVPVYSQNTSYESGTSLDYLKQTFPKLTELYLDDLNNCHTHYIFAVDVSGSMIKYNDTVTPSLQAFAQALPFGEEVSIIPFGTDAKENTPGLCCKIKGNSQKQVLSESLSSLYVNDGYSSEFRRNTDINKAISAINKAILNNQEVQMNVIVIITDFLNDLPEIGEVKLESSDLEQLNKDFDNVTNDKYTRVVAMQLPKAGTGKGFCLDQLQEEVFCNTSITKRFDVIQAIKDKSAISHWFEQLARDIMTEKLKAVIQLDNERNLHPTLNTKIDIDGNVIAEIHWTPNKLYKEIKLDSTYTDEGSDYVFCNNKEVWQTTKDTALVDLELGRLEHKHWGFRHFKENLNIGMSLPTPYDEELKRLSIDKPIQATSDEQSGWLFTFFLSFMTCCIIIVLIIIYLISVYRTAAYNKSIKIKGYLTVRDSKGKTIIDQELIRPTNSTTIGQGNYSVEGAKWTIKIHTIPGVCWVWKKTKWGYTMVDGYIDGTKKKTFNSKKVSISMLSVGPYDPMITHQIQIDKK